MGIDEAASKEYGAITLDLVLRAGILVEAEDGSWTVADNYLTRRIYLYGDAKRVENMVKFVRDMQDRRISYSAANVQPEVFLKALEVVMDLPGDWHTGLNMAQTIYSYCYVGFLDQFQELLGWKRVNKEVSQCYFQATRLIAFVHDELNCLFAHQYVAERAETETGTDKDDDADHIVATAIGYLKRVRGLKLSSDKWVSTCAVFLKMANDYL